VIVIGAGDGIHGDHGARGAAILRRRIRREDAELVDAIRRRERGGEPVEAMIVETPLSSTSVFRVRLPLIDSCEVDG